MEIDAGNGLTITLAALLAAALFGAALAAGFVLIAARSRQAFVVGAAALVGAVLFAGLVLVSGLVALISRLTLGAIRVALAAAGIALLIGLAGLARSIRAALLVGLARLGTLR